MENQLDEVLKSLDLEYFATGEYRIEFDQFLKMKEKGKAMMLDVRTDEEADVCKLAFAKHIPINELPDRLNELPKDKLIVPFCASSVRAAIALVYLNAVGFDDVRMYVGKISDLTSNLMPPHVSSHYDVLKEI